MTHFFPLRQLRLTLPNSKRGAALSRPHQAILVLPPKIALSPDKPFSREGGGGRAYRTARFFSGIVLLKPSIAPKEGAPTQPFQFTFQGRRQWN